MLSEERLKVHLNAVGHAIDGMNILPLITSPGRIDRASARQSIK